MGGATATDARDSSVQVVVEVAVSEAKPLPLINKAKAPGAEPWAPVHCVPYLSLFRDADAKDWVLMALGALGAVANGLIAPAFTIAMGSLLNAFFADDLASEIRAFVLVIFYIALLGFACGVLEVGCFMWTGARQANRLRCSYMSSLLRQDMAWFDKEASLSGRVLEGLNADVQSYQAAISERLGNFIHNLAMFGGGIGVAFWRGWDLALVVLASLPVLVVASAVIGVFLGRMQNRAAAAYSAAGSLTLEALSNIRTVAAYGQEEQTVRAYIKALEKTLRAGFWQGVLTGGAVGFTTLVFFCSYGLALWFGAVRVAAGHYSGGYVLNVLLSAVMAGFGLGQAVPQLHFFREGRVAAAALFAVTSAEPVMNPDAPGDTLPAVEGDLELSNITFSYPSSPSRKVLNAFSLVIPAGSTLAVVGPSGSGKSTVIQLLLRFYDPCAGAVLLDGHDLRTLQLRWLRQQLGLVSQQPALFNTSILANIAYGRPGASDQEIIEAATAANAHGFIRKLPMGYDTEVGMNGTQLSGGQKQRIAIARAILRNPRILLLDEATSALDVQAERAVQAALESLMEGRTTVIVAHRLSTIFTADTIAVVKAGEVAELGNHQQLMQLPSGVYATLVAKQQLVGADTLEEHGDPKQAAAAAKAPVRTLRESVLRRGSVRLSVIPSAIQAKLAGRQAAEVGTHAVPFSRLAALNRPEWPLGVMGTLCSAALGLQMPGFSLAFAAVLSALYNPDPDSVRAGGQKWGIVFAAMGLGCFALSTLQGYSFAQMGQRLSYRVRIALLRAMLRQEIGFFDMNSSGALASISSNASAVRGAVGDPVGLLVQNLSCVIASYTIAFYSSWSMTLVVTAALPLLLVGQSVQTSIAFGTNHKDTLLLTEANTVASEAISAIKTVTAFGMQDQLVTLYSRAVSKSSPGRLAAVSGTGFGFSQFVLYATFCLAFWFGGTQVVAGRITFQDMLQAFFAIFYAAQGLAQASLSFPDIGKAQASVQGVFRIIDRTPEIDSGSTAGAVLDSVEGRVEIRDVTFAYPNRPGRLVLKGFHLEIPPGTTCALVGESGGGKSTVIQLLERFYEPLAGAVLIDGIDIRTFNTTWMRSTMGLVPQEPVTFRASVADNIRIGRASASETEVAAAARAANALDFVERLPEGMATLVGEGGIQLSGGQKQRIAIARALLRNPRILLLDEATSALDTESEALVQAALDNLMAGRTTVVVAHRLSTIQRADKIAVVYRGRVLEQGNHAELLASNGYYAFMASH